MKRINQLAKDLNENKSSIYRLVYEKLNLKLEKYIHKINNVMHIDEQGEEIIKQYLEENYNKNKIRKVSNEEIYFELYEIKESIQEIKEILNNINQNDSIKEIQVKKDPTIKINKEVKEISNQLNEKKEIDIKIKEMLNNKIAVREIMKVLKVGSLRIKRVREEI